MVKNTSSCVKKTCWRLSSNLRKTLTGAFLSEPPHT
jgi:hypothetical protein